MWPARYVRPSLVWSGYKWVPKDEKDELRLRQACAKSNNLSNPKHETKIGKSVSLFYKGDHCWGILSAPFLLSKEKNSWDGGTLGISWVRALLCWEPSPIRITPATSRSRGGVFRHHNGKKAGIDPLQSTGEKYLPRMVFAFFRKRRELRIWIYAECRGPFLHAPEANTCGDALVFYKTLHIGTYFIRWERQTRSNFVCWYKICSFLWVWIIRTSLLLMKMK